MPAAAAHTDIDEILREVGPDSTATFDNTASNPTEHASSESLYAADVDEDEDEEDDVEDDDLDEDDEDDDEDIEDDDEDDFDDEDDDEDEKNEEEDV